MYVLRHDPKEYVLEKGGDAKLMETVREAYGKLDIKNSFYLERGCYTLAAVVDESEAGDKPLTLKGKFIDLFDPELPVLREKTVKPGEQAFLFDISRVKDKKQPQVLAAASRQYDEQRTANSYSFVAKSPAQTSNVMRILLPKKAKSVKVEGTKDCTWDWNSNDLNTLLLKFENNPDGVKVDITW